VSIEEGESLCHGREIACCTKPATGTEDEKLKGYGDPSSNAKAMVLKRAAAKFGLGLYLYSR